LLIRWIYLEFVCLIYDFFHGLSLTKWNVFVNYLLLYRHNSSRQWITEDSCDIILKAAFRALNTDYTRLIRNVNYFVLLLSYFFPAHPSFIAFVITSFIPRTVIATCMEVFMQLIINRWVWCYLVLISFSISVWHHVTPLNGVTLILYMTYLSPIKLT